MDRAQLLLISAAAFGALILLVLISVLVRRRNSKHASSSAAAAVLVGASTRQFPAEEQPPESRDGEEPGGSQRNIPELMGPRCQPAVLITTVDEPGTASYFGGLPAVPPDFRWPMRDARPLGFLASIHLPDVPPVLDWLPRHGQLLFFCDREDEPWGCDPQDRGGFAVIYLESAPAEDFAEASLPAGMADAHILTRRGIRFRSASLPPEWDDVAVDDFTLSEDEQDALMSWRSDLEGEALHQIGGFPASVQDPNMQLECQFASRGIDPAERFAAGIPRKEDLASAAEEWKLLLQIRSDDDLGVMWGDAGTLFFWVRADAARRGDFDDSWVVIQCH